MDLPGLGVKDALVIPKKESSKGETSSVFLRVIPESKVYDVMQQVHCKELNHAGYKKMQGICKYIVSISLSLSFNYKKILFTNNSSFILLFLLLITNLFFFILQVQCHYNGITKSYITEFCKQCPICQLQQPKKVHPPLHPITVEDFMQRIQIDLINMRHSPDDEFNWTGHFIDHMSKFNILFPLKTKSAPEVARLFKERVLAYLGPPHTFHSYI